MPTPVVILSPTRLQREAWRALLAGLPEIAVCGAAGDLAGAAAAPWPGRPGVILLDLHWPDPEAVRQLRALAPHPGLLALTPGYNLPEVLRLLQAGATGCLSRDAAPGELARALIAAGRGELVLPPEIAGQTLAALARGDLPQAEPVEPLSPREGEVLALLAQGLTNKDIAQVLFLSVRTVEAHLRSLYGKLGARSRTEAALWAVRRGFAAPNQAIPP